jgi:mannitol/fructose-specific phosphotransferase system IIA component (Ntr-type)
MPEDQTATQSLTEMLPEDRIRLDVQAGSWEDAVRAAGQLLVDTNAVEDRYVDAMVNMVNEIGPYIVVAPGVAMPHARPSDGVEQNAFSFVRLQAPVEFGSEENDPVHLVFALAAVDKEQHVGGLQQLATLISDSDAKRAVTQASTVEEVAGIIAGHRREAP